MFSLSRAGLWYCMKCWEIFEEEDGGGGRGGGGVLILGCVMSVVLFMWRVRYGLKLFFSFYFSLISLYFFFCGAVHVPGKVWSHEF